MVTMIVAFHGDGDDGDFPWSNGERDSNAISPMRAFVPRASTSLLLLLVPIGVAEIAIDAIPLERLVIVE